MKQYLELLEDVMTNGHAKNDRTGTGTLSVFGRQMRFDLTKGFPLVTTKKCHLRSIIHELLWFLKGETNTKYLKENGVRIWDEWAAPEDVLDRAATLQAIINVDAFSNSVDTFLKLALVTTELDLMTCDIETFIKFLESHISSVVSERNGELVHIDQDINKYLVYKARKGDLGPVYGKQWRNWEGKDGKFHDQIANVIDMLKRDPDSRRIIVSAWNVGELDEMALMPCHAFFQFYTRELTLAERVEIARARGADIKRDVAYTLDTMLKFCREYSVGKRALSCQLYQR